MAPARAMPLVAVPMRRRRGVLPGYAPAMGFTLTYLGLIVLLPLGALILKTREMGWSEFTAAVSGPRALAAYRLSFGASLAAALINCAGGLLVAWVLVRYEFSGKRWVDALVDLPFALPTAVAGIALTTIYAPNGWAGRALLALGIRVAFAPAGVVLALTFVGLPFVVRTVQPVLQETDPRAEEAAAVLGAGRLRTFASVVFPALLPALLTGFSLAFARALSEYGSVVFISGNMPFQTEIVPLLIMTKLEQFDYRGATAIAVVMLAASFALLLGTNVVLAWLRERRER